MFSFTKYFPIPPETISFIVALSSEGSVLVPLSLHEGPLFVTIIFIPSFISNGSEATHDFAVLTKAVSLPGRRFSKIGFRPYDDFESLNCGVLTVLFNMIITFPLLAPRHETSVISKLRFGFLFTINLYSPMLTQPLTLTVLVYITWLSATVLIKFTESIMYAEPILALSIER